MSISRYSLETFDLARHGHELQASKLLPGAAACCFFCHCRCWCGRSCGGGGLLCISNINLSVPPAACCSGFCCRLPRMPPLPGIQLSAGRLEACLLLPPPPRTYALTHAHTTPTTTHTLANTHSRQLPTTTHCVQASDHLNVHLDCAHMGVGGDDSWSPTGRLKGQSWALVGCIMLNPSVLAGHPWPPMSTLLCLGPFPARHPAPHACPCSAPVRFKTTVPTSTTLLASYPWYHTTVQI